MKKVNEPVTIAVNDASKDVTKTMMVTSKENNESSVCINNEISEKLMDSILFAV